ncbi:MAG: hypothetical protein ACYDCO_10830 [Armatimonadota bacterium]
MWRNCPGYRTKECDDDTARKPLENVEAICAALERYRYYFSG